MSRPRATHPYPLNDCARPLRVRVSLQVKVTAFIIAFTSALTVGRTLVLTRLTAYLEAIGVTADAVRVSAVLSGSVTILLSALGALLIIRFFIARPLDRLSGFARTLAAGDLRQHVDIHTGDEFEQLAAAFNQMAATLHRLLAEAGETADRVAAASQRFQASATQAAAQLEQVKGSIGRTVSEVASATHEQHGRIQEVANVVVQQKEAIEQLAAGAQAQARHVAETTTLVEDMGRFLGALSVDLGSLDAATEETARVAGEGGVVVKDTLDAMEKVKQAVGQPAERMRLLQEQSEQIGNISAMIGTIADRTNLLALNAALEAARAGEHGRGFAVVAEEVRSLARKSQDATREIRAIVAGIQESIAEVSAALRRATQETETGSSLAARAGTALATIVEHVQGAARHAARLLGEAQQMAERNARVTTAVQNVAAVAEQNAASAEEMAAGSGQVEDAARELGRMAAQTLERVRTLTTTAEAAEASLQQVADLNGAAQDLARAAVELRAQVARFQTV